MAISGLVLITVGLANVLAAQAECCNCDCRTGSLSNVHQSQLYYVPLVLQQQSKTHLEENQHYQNLGIASLANVAHLTQAAPIAHSGHQIVGQYEVTEALENKVQVNLPPVQNIQSQQQLYISGAQEHLGGAQEHLEKAQGQLDTAHSSDSNIVPHFQQVSKVSTHQGDHYINIERKFTPQQNSVDEYDHLGKEKDHDHHDKNDYYKFEYSVNDQKTHDIKSQREEKKGDVVQGEYSLVEDDGNVRTVKYYADWKTGFHAQVHNSKKTSLG